jgi:hypothetical protein
MFRKAIQILWEVAWQRLPRLVKGRIQTPVATACSLSWAATLNSDSHWDSSEHRHTHLIQHHHHPPDGTQTTAGSRLTIRQRHALPLSAPLTSRESPASTKAGGKAMMPTLTRTRNAPTTATQVTKQKIGRNVRGEKVRDTFQNCWDGAKITRGWDLWAPLVKQLSMIILNRPALRSRRPELEADNSPHLKSPFSTILEKQYSFSLSRNYPHFLGHECPLQCIQEPATGRYRELDEL